MKFGKDVFDVRRNGLRREHQVCGDLSIGKPIRDLARHCVLARSQRMPRLHGRALVADELIGYPTERRRADSGRPSFDCRSDRPALGQLAKRD